MLLLLGLLDVVLRVVGEDKMGGWMDRSVLMSTSIQTVQRVRKIVYTKQQIHGSRTRFTELLAPCTFLHERD